MFVFFKKIKELWHGKDFTPEELEERRREAVRRKAYILGAGAGSAMRPDDGVVRIRSLKDGDDSICDDLDS